MLLIIILASFIVSLISFVGILFYKNVEKHVLFWVSFASGVLLTAAFIALIPESLENSFSSYFILLGFVSFLFLERFFHWHHCTETECHSHSTGLLVLFGDGLHNFVDGLIIAASFLVDFKTGLFTSLAIVLHEIPQEVGDFAVLLHSGYSKTKALLYNFFSALTSVLGAITGFFIFEKISVFIPYIIGFAAGGFIYISASDLIPKILKEKEDKKLLLYFLLGIIIFIILKILVVE